MSKKVSPPELSLSQIERLTIRQLWMREQRLVREHIAPLQADFQELFSVIETRLGLPPGSLGSGYVIDPESFKIEKNQ